MPQLDRPEYSSLSRDHPNYHKKIARLIENKSRNNHEEEELQDALYRCKFDTGFAIQLDQEMSRRKHAITEQDKHMKRISAKTIDYLRDTTTTWITTLHGGATGAEDKDRTQESIR